MKRKFKRKRGYLTFAQNSESVNWVARAHALALSLKATQREVPHLSVVVTPGTVVSEEAREVFDEVIDLPWLDESVRMPWKVENLWKAYHCTPYEETVLLAADMLIPIDLSAWWLTMTRQDVVVCTKATSFRGENLSDDIRRRWVTPNNLPDVRSAFVYFRYGELAEEMFTQAEHIFHNRERFFFEFMDGTRPERLEPDAAFALSVLMTGRPEECVSVSNIPAIAIIPPISDGDKPTIDVMGDGSVRVGWFRQTLPVHYGQGVNVEPIIAAYNRVLS